MYEAARQGGSIVPPINYKKLYKVASQIPAMYVDCEDVCLQGGPCPHGRKQAKSCLDSYKKQLKRQKKWRFYQKHMPYSEEQLRQFKRTQLISYGAMLGLSPFKYSGDGLFKKVLKRQDKWARKRKVGKYEIRVDEDIPVTDGTDGTPEQPPETGATENP